jgi:hypothetical protein
MNGFIKAIAYASRILLSAFSTPPHSSAQSNQPQQEAFWRWFKENEDRIYDFEQNQEAIFNEIAEHLSLVDPDLTFEVGGIVDNTRQFIISANGIKAVFPSVISLVDQAPTLTKWKVIKFRQRETDFNSIELEGAEVAMQEVFFSIEPNGELANLTIFIRGYDGSTSYKQIGYLFLDAVLGEFDVATKCRFIEFKPINPNERRKTRPICELPDVLDRLISAAMK